MALRNCTRCGLSVKGHPGQCGEKCQVDMRDFNFDTSTTTLFDRDEQRDKGVVDHHAGAHHTGAQTALSPANVAHKQQPDTSSDKATLQQQSDVSLSVRELSQHMLNLSLDVKGVLEQNNQILKVLMRTDGPARNEASPTIRNNGLETGIGTTPHGHYLEGGSKLTDATYKNAISGEFVNLIDFLPSTETRDLEAHVSDETLQFKPRKAKKSLDNFSTWLQAWNEFESVVMSVHPDLYNNLSTYRRFIQSMDRKYIWPAVYSYDMRFRTELARKQSFGYNIQNNDLVVSILDATAVKADINRCFRCKSVDHVIQECPFPALKVQVETAQKKEKRSTAQFRWYHAGKEGCNNFNYGKCHFSQCTRAHVCKSCRGTEPYVTCPQCNRD